MIDNGLKNSPAYRVAYSMYVALGGDPTTDFDSVEAIYDAIDVLFGKGNNRITVETIALEIVENGDYNFDDEEVTGYKPVNIKVEVPQKYTDEQIETIRVEAETTGYNNGYGVGYAEGDIAGQQTGYNTGYTEGFTQGETEGYNDGYAEGLDDGVEDQKALLEDITITENGVYEKEDGYKKVTVEVPETIFETETLTVELTDNGTYNYTPTTNGYSSVEVTVDVASSGSGDGFDFSVLGYDAAYSNQLNNELRSTTQDAIDYSKQIYDNWNPNVTSLRNKFSNDIKLKYFPLVSTSKVTDMYSMFTGCSSLTSIPLLDTSKVTNMERMFYGCSSLTSIPLLDTSKVTTMYYIFCGCSSLTSIPLLDTSKVTNMYDMFYGCSSLTSIPQLDTSSVTDMSSMFSGCSSLTSIPLLDTSIVTGMNSIFRDCSSLTSIPLLDTSSVTDMSYMFHNCSSLTSIPELDCNKVSGVSYFIGFNEIKTLTDLGGFKNLGAVSSLSGTSNNYFLAKLPNLTHESIMNVINNLYDRASAGYSVLTLKLHADTLTLLSDEEKAIATNKGWTLS